MNSQDLHVGNIQNTEARQVTKLRITLDAQDIRTICNALENHRTTDGDRIYVNLTMRLQKTNEQHAHGYAEPFPQEQGEQVEFT